MTGLQTASGMRPVLVTARVAGGVGFDVRWGTALDGLLAATMWAQMKAELRGRGDATVPLADQDVPADLPLPLARCAPPGGVWHWAATFAQPVAAAGVEDGASDVRWLHTAFDQRHGYQVGERMPESIPAHYGRYLRWRLPVVITLCSEVTWRAVGDPGGIRELLGQVAAFGKKRSHGEGRVLEWSVVAVDDIPEVSWWDWAHLHHRGGGLGRTTPLECLHDRQGVADGGVGIGGIRPPYTHPARRRELALPVPLDGGW